MKKSLFLLFTLCALLTACSDNGLSAEEEQLLAEIEAGDPYGKNSEEGLATYCALDLLCNVDSLPNDWRSATFAPTYGYATDQANPYVRTVYVDDVSEAENCFRSLGGTIERGDASATYEVGSLKYVYTALNQTDLFATIDVSVPQIPNLVQLRFVPNSAQEENGLFGYSWKTSDVPYYSVGDVVQCDKDETYWICVRPAYNGIKHKTYWVSFDPKQMQIKSYNKNNVIVPTKLGTNVEQFENFAQLMGCFGDPYKYVKDINGYSLWNEGFGICRRAISPLVIANLQIDWGKSYYTKDGSSRSNLSEGKQVWDILDFTEDKQFFDKEYNLFYKGYSSFGWTMTLWSLNCKPGNPSEDIPFFLTKNEKDLIEPKEHHWKLEANNYFHIGNYYKDGAQGTASGNNVANMPPKALCVWDYVYTGDPTKPMPGFTTIYHYRDPHYLMGDVLFDQDGCRWICVQPAYQSDYSYFVSFDFASNDFVPTDEEILPQLPPKEILPYALALLQQWQRFTVTGAYSKNLTNRFFEHNLLGDGTNTVIDLRSLATCFIRGKGEQAANKRHLVNYAYNGVADDGTMVRAMFPILMKDETYKLGFRTKYTDNETTMKLLDVNNQTLVTQFATSDTLAHINANGYFLYATLSDKREIENGAQETYRTTVENDAKLSDYLYANNHDATQPGFYKKKNMFQEGVQLFRICRVRDLGDNNYDSGTTIKKKKSGTTKNITFTPYRLCRDDETMLDNISLNIDKNDYQKNIFHFARNAFYGNIYDPLSLLYRPKAYVQGETHYVTFDDVNYSCPPIDNIWTQYYQE